MIGPVEDRVGRLVRRGARVGVHQPEFDLLHKAIACFSPNAAPPRPRQENPQVGKSSSAYTGPSPQRLQHRRSWPACRPCADWRSVLAGLKAAISWRFLAPYSRMRAHA
jgi:hypothetical protein